MIEHIALADAGYRAAFETAAVFDRSVTAALVLAGKDAAAFLSNLSTNDIKAVPVGGGCETYFCDHRAKALFQTWVFREAEHNYRVEAVPGRGEALLKHLDRYLISEVVEIQDVSGTFALYHVTGPSAEHVMNAAFGEPLPPLEALQHLPRPLKTGGTVRVRRNDYLGQPGFDVLCEKANDQPAWHALTDAGATPATDDDWNVLRVEAGQPVYGPDIDETRFVMEVADAERAVSYAKGCYLGQEPIVMARDRAGHAPRSFVRLELDGAAPPSPGAKIAVGGDEAGHVTSAVYSPRFGKVVALGYVRWKHREPGAAVNVGPLAGVVTKR